MSVWSGLKVAVLGGDARETEIAALAVEAGAVVRRFGTPDAGAGRHAGEVAIALHDALRGARVAIGPVPFPGPDGRLFAPHASEPIYLDVEALRAMDVDGHVVIGKATDDLLSSARAVGVVVHQFEHDTELMLLRAPAIAEGAIAAAIERSPVTIHASPIGVLGFGRTARGLTRALLGLGAKVHVFARKAEARAEAYGYGASAHALVDVPEIFPRLEIVFNTVPAPVVDRAVLSMLRPGTLVVDMSAPPPGVDHAAAEELGLDLVWARGLGASAPRTVGASQWVGISRIIEAALA
ncbi:MAG TPA: dipicolinate synthase subunit DpsA [Actinomycetota bacterium]|nr:dipicolinate synthase subunit DpsA [Actinomycetota bacterium]